MAEPPPELTEAQQAKLAAKQFKADRAKHDKTAKEWTTKYAMQ